MRGRPARLIVALAAMAAACGQARPERAQPRATEVRAAGRAYDGAPPVIPHDAQVGACALCHDADGAAIPGIGVAPASPHGGQAAEGAMRRCLQCHVPQAATTLLVASRFTGLPQGPWRGSRATPGAPPRIPHTLHLRGECLTCHAGPGARTEILTSHPDRIRCVQCHVPDGPLAARGAVPSLF